MNTMPKEKDSEKYDSLKTYDTSKKATVNQSWLMNTATSPPWLIGLSIQSEIRMSAENATNHFANKLSSISCVYSSSNAFASSILPTLNK